MRLTISIFLFVAAFTSAAPVPKGVKKDPAEALEEKLHGDWKGGACMGTITFNADGTYKREHFTPGNIALSGTGQFAGMLSLPRSS